ncbi:MAG: hypothetical protein ABFD69_10305 [Candidatus Sumerlaeia bacterium]
MAGILKKLMGFMFLGRGAGEGMSGISSSTPEGLERIHTAMNSIEAEMLRQVLTDAGFSVEFVPSASTSVFGTSGSSEIFVAAPEAQAAAAYLNEYLGSK